jgi:23S rRNA pseudouridine2605 synthase/23S rRNA pseudouridine2604 synthase
VTLVRLQKALADRGLSSRRGAEALIKEGRVKVNGAVVTEMGVKVDPEKDLIELDPAALKAAEKARVVLMLNKPVGFTTTKSEGEGMTVIDLVRRHPRFRELNPVGRLDKDSSGLLLLTNDGLLQYAIVNPQTHLEKEYEVKVGVPPLPSQLKRMQEGMTLEGHKLRSCVVEKIDAMSFRIILTEGRNRQIRKMADKVGLKVTRLKRLRVGPQELGPLAEGAWRELSAAEVKALQASVSES